jgi:hypothetical protein
MWRIPLHVDVPCAFLAWTLCFRVHTRSAMVAHLQPVLCSSSVAEMQAASSVCRAVTGHEWETSHASSNTLAERTACAYRPQERKQGFASLSDP